MDIFPKSVVFRFMSMSHIINHCYGGRHFPALIIDSIALTHQVNSVAAGHNKLPPVTDYVDNN